MSDSLTRNAWRSSVISVVILLSLVFIFYQQTVLYLLGLWNQLGAGEYGHGYLVMAISAYLIYCNRHRLSALKPEAEYRAVLAVVAASLFWMLAALVDIAVLQAVGLLLLVLAIVWASLGNQVTRVLVFPILYIGFAIPFWFPLSPVLQQITADIVYWLIRLLEVPSYRIENTIVLPAGRLSIEESCSGLRYFLASLTLGTLYAYLNYKTLAARLAVVLIFAAAAVLANILRVFIVVYLGYTSDMEHPLVYDHLNLGWYLFAGLIVALLVIETVVQRKTGLAKVVSESSSAREDTQQVSNRYSKPRLFAVALIVSFFIFAPPLSVYWIHNPSQSVQSSIQITLPEKIGTWTVIDAGDDGWKPLYSGALVRKAVLKDDADRKIYLYLGLYAAQGQGAELINDLNRISDNRTWRIKYKRAKLYNTGRQQVFEQLLEKKDGSQRLVWYWYNVAGQNTVNKYKAKLLQVLGLLQGNRRAAIVAVAAKLDGEPGRTREVLNRFITGAGGAVDGLVTGQNGTSKVSE